LGRPNLPKPQAASPLSLSLADVWGPPSSASSCSCMSQIPPMESGVAPTPSWLELHAEPLLLNSSRAHAACSTILFTAAALISSL
jgi:hypothetical protein